MDANTAIQKMWTIADKPERLRCFHKIVFDLGLDEAKLFWSNFWSIWQTSENLNEEYDYIPDLIDHGRSLGSPHVGLEENEIEALSALPDLITIYRGCLDWNQDGWSWTTDREKAVWFAKRAYGDDKRLVLTATARKEDVLGYLLGRNESEIVIHPDDVLDVELDEMFDYEGDKMAGLVYAIHSGRDIFAGEEMEKARAEMMVRTMTPPIDKHIAQFEEMLDFIRWADLKQKRRLLEEVVRLLKEKRDDPNAAFEQPNGFAL
jgi:hypothetical protein